MNKEKEGERRVRSNGKKRKGRGRRENRERRINRKEATRIKGDKKRKEKRKM